MAKTAYVIENDKIVNILHVDEDTDLTPFNAEFIDGYVALHIGYARKNGEWYDENGVPAPKIDPVKMQADIVRVARDDLLAKSDWTQLADSPLTEEEKADWAAYRQALRDITENPDFPFGVSFPLSPHQKQ